jgi:hypothetical protein
MAVVALRNSDVARSGALWLRSLAKDRAEIAFDRVQLGMSCDEVDAAIAMEGGHRAVSKELTEERSFYAAVYRFARRTVDGRTRNMYAKVGIIFDRQDRVVNKKLYWFEPTLWHKLTHWVTRIRAAVGL